MQNTTILPRFTKSLLVGLLATSAAAPVLSADLLVTIEPVEQSKGQLMVALFNSKETFQETQLSSQKAEASEGSMQFSFNDLPEGEYAIMVYHDVNDNAKLDTNLLGLPTEPWGASLQGKRVFGAPGWKDTRFELSESDFSLTIRLN